MIDNKKKIFSPAAVTFLVLAGFLLRFSVVNQGDLYTDEALSWHVSHVNLPDLFQDLESLEIKPPLYFISLHYWIALFGDSESAMRLLSVVMWVPTILILVGITGMLNGIGKILVAWMALFMPAFVYYNMEARPYSLLLLMETLYFYLILRILDSDSIGGVILAGLVFFLVLSTQFTGLFFVAPVAAYFLFRNIKQRKRMLVFLGVHLLFFICFVAMILAMMPDLRRSIERAESTWWASTPSVAQLVTSPIRLFIPVAEWGPYINDFNIISLVNLIGACTILCLAIYGIICSKYKWLLGSSTFLVIFLFAMYSIFRTNLLYSRFFIGVLPILLVCSVIGLTRVREKQYVVFVALLVITIATPPLMFLQFQPFKIVKRQEYHVAAEILKNQPENKLPVAAAGGDYYPLEYYLKRVGYEGKLFPISTDTQLKGEFYYISTYSWGDRKGELLAGLVKGGWKFVLIYDRDYIKIYRISRKN